MKSCTGNSIIQCILCVCHMYTCTYMYLFSLNARLSLTVEERESPVHIVCA